MASSAVTSEVTAPPRLHLKHVEGLRAAAALVVYLNHAYAQVWERGPGTAPDGVLAPLSYSLIAGHLSVSVFIVVSGFCLTLPVVGQGDQLRGGVLMFIKRRALRILPPYYAAVALSLALIWTVIGQPTGTLWDVPIQVNLNAILSHLLLLQDLFATGSINYVFWSIAVEWQIYFLFPLLLLGWRRLGPLATVALALAAGYALRIGFDGTRLARTNCHFIGLFALGMLGAYIASSPAPRYTRARDHVAWPWVCGILFAAACWLVTLKNVTFPLLDAVVGVMTCAALVVSSRNQTNILNRALSFRPLVAIGTFSYSLYLIHAPLLQLLWQYVLDPLGLGPTTMFALLMSIGLLCVLAASHAFFRAFEAPFMRARARARAVEASATVPVA